ncbi:hypothetical protein TNIN_142411 [Trichonephila inaurata madagascariensis]|uniref:Uncharacterized protein n=1 Tax=Trichonephila inaurata madagascariensis TaxID=2747483 RepID=A0A8X6WX70_9ARAC|nr:hypothetical protein TNIN_142411 [Trichonephila inaurata madagascariensis]
MNPADLPSFSEAALPITLIVPVNFETDRLPDENGSPVRAGRVIYGQNETLHPASLSVTLNDPRPAFPLTIPDYPEPEEGDHSDASSNNSLVGL